MSKSREGDKFEVRQTTTSDFEAVMKISEGLYSGMDIIPSVFHEYVTDANRVFFVAVDKRSRELVRARYGDTFSRFAQFFGSFRFALLEFE